MGDVLTLHARPENAGALFQAASQFNCLEFPGPGVVPEDGVAGAPGQTVDRQLNNLDALQARLGRAPDGGTFFEVRNGYTFSTDSRLRALRDTLGRHDRETLPGAVKIGLQRGAQVTFAQRFVEPSSVTHASQAFCSALSCGYSVIPLDLWRPLATLVLDAAYEATLLAAVVDAATSDGSAKVWLTFLGAGAFRNDPAWIAAAIGRALARCADRDIDVRIAHYREIDVSMRVRIEAERRA